MVNALRLKKFELKFVNGKGWQQMETNPQNNLIRTFLILMGLFQKPKNKKQKKIQNKKTKQKTEPWKLIRSAKSKTEH